MPLNEPTTQDLLQIITQKFGLTPQDDEPTNYRYVIYVRKSTDDKKNQVRSLPDQIIDCKKLVEARGLRVVAPPIKEAESAKEPDVRRKFREMINDLKAGKYDGIIAWHPDRLARNMKEAGEIIDLLDKGTIKDLQFVSFPFTNDTSGKMTLGITFVMSKQYSDQLSDRVKGAVSKRLLEGKYFGRAKAGYYRDRDKLLRPDAENFALMKKAWQMRLEGKTFANISEFLNENNFSSALEIGGVKHEKAKMGDSTLTKIFSDPVFAGVLKRGDLAVDLTEIYDFEPMISVEEFLKLNKTDSLVKRFHQKSKAFSSEPKKADLARRMVICGGCGVTRSAYVVKKKNNNTIIFVALHRAVGIGTAQSAVRLLPTLSMNS